MNKLSQLIEMLPNEVKQHIYEYNSEHRKKMYWCLRQIKENYCRCDFCDKIIIGYVYSRSSPSRKWDEDDMQCCSAECVEDLEWEQLGYETENE